MDLPERIRKFSTKSPSVAANAYIAPGAVLVGAVTLGENSSVWFQSALRADLNSITVGARSNIQDGAIVHVADAHGTVIGQRVTVGHGAVIHACTIDDEVLVGMNAVVLDGAHIGARSIIGANALVTSGTHIPEGSLFLGSPGKVVRHYPRRSRQALRRGLSAMSFLLKPTAMDCRKSCFRRQARSLLSKKHSPRFTSPLFFRHGNRTFTRISRPFAASRPPSRGLASRFDPF